MEHFEYPAGAVIFLVGDPAEKCFLIHSGKVELRRGTGDSDDRAAQLGVNEVFGEMSLIDERPHSLSARAVTNVHLTALTRDEFDQELKIVSDDLRVCLKALFERLRTISSEIPGTPVIANPLAKIPKTISVILHPLTRLAASMLPYNGLQIEKFPFRIGREAMEDEPSPPDTNDLWLRDKSPYNVSRNHASIDVKNDTVIIKDRGSSLGVVVNEVLIGGGSYERQASLDEGDNLVVLGGCMSKFQFRIEVRRT
jgi:hypothetical protein